MKYKEIENEAALDLMADILTPAAEIFGDAEIKKISENGTKLEMIQAILKKHKSAIIEIFAAMDGVKPEEYHANIITMTKNLLELLSDPDIKSFFI